jgi:pilus assembly protein Flp/PilA
VLRGSLARRGRACSASAESSVSLSELRTKGGESLVLQIYTAIMSFIHRDEEEGQGLAEYALILALIAIVAIIALIFLGGQVSKILSTVGGSV